MQENRQSSATPEKAITPFHSSRWKMILYGVGMAIILALYVWSRGGGTTHVRVEVRDDAYTLSLDGHTILSERISAWDTGGIGYKQYRKAVPIIPQYQSITNIVVTDLDTNEILFTENFEGSELDKSTWPLQLGQWEVDDHALTAKDQEAALLRPDGWRNYTFEADVRNMLGAHFYVRVQDQNNFVGCFMRPFRDFDGNFFVMKNGRKSHQTPVKTVLLSPTQTAKRSLNLVLHYFPHFVLLFVLALLLTLALAYLLHRLYLYLNRFITITVKASPPKCPFTVERCFTGLALLLVVAAFLWLLHVTSAYLEKIPHVQDSATMVFQAKTYASGRLWIPASQHIRSFTLGGFTPVRDGKMFGQYPLGHPLFLLPGALIGQIWVMPAVGGALLLLVVFLIGKQLFSAPWGFLASFLLFCSPFYQMSAPNFMPHTTGALYLAASVYFFIRIEARSGMFVQPALSGAFLGLLFNTRPMTAVGICVSYALLMTVSFFRSNAKKQLCIKYLFFLLGSLALWGLYLLYNHLIMGDPLKHTYGATADKVLRGSLDWTRFAKAGLDNFTLAGLFLLLLFGWNGYFSTVFIFGNLLPGDRPKRYILLLFCSMVFVFAAYMPYSISSVVVMYGPRYVFEIAPLYVLLVVGGTRSLLNIISGGWLSPHRQTVAVAGLGSAEHRIVPRMVPVALTAFVFALLVGLGARSFASWTSKTSRPWPGNAYVPQNVHDLKGFNHVSPVIQKIVKKHGIANALIFVEGSRYEWWHYGSVFAENTPRFDGDVVYATDLGVQLNRKVALQYPQRLYYRANYVKRTAVEVDQDLNQVGDKVLR